MKTIKELDALPPMMEAGYQLCKKEVRELINEIESHWTYTSGMVIEKIKEGVRE